MFNSFVAIGDSFTEGVGDIHAQYPNQVRGWADRVAEVCAEHNPDFQYANLAIRGKKIQQIIDEQLDHAITLQPELISFIGGGNDITRPNVDVDEVIQLTEQVFQRLRAETSSQIITFTYADLPPGWYATILRGRFSIFNEFLREMVDKYSLILVDWWKMYPTYRLDAYWCPDKIHMSTLGHIYLSHRVLSQLGYTPAEDAVITDTLLRHWPESFLRGTALPWIWHRIRRVSSGDNLSPKYPQFIKPAAFSLLWN